jgi:2-polyprenyl-6-methoxyphenol hydroxylase-like FAD-dependent oxidoreductase
LNRKTHLGGGQCLKLSAMVAKGDPQRARVAIIGAGIVGLTTALALRQAGFHVSVFEQADQIRAAGASLGLWRNALTVFDRLGVGKAIAALGKPAEMYLHDPSGRLLDPPGFSVEDHRYLLVNRARLTDLLAEAVGSSAIRLGSRLVGFDEGTDAVVARFEDGASERADLLVGADGVYSTVRLQLFPGAVAQEHTGHHAWRAVVPPGPIEVPGDVMVVGRSRCRGGFARTPDGGGFWLVSQFESPQLTRTKREEAYSRALELDEGGWNATLLQLVRSTPEDRILYNQVMVAPELDCWTSSRVVLVGDAAHAISPHITAGASLGVEDATLLADCLESEPNLPMALKAFEQNRIPHYATARALARDVETYSTPLEFAIRYATFSHWMINE